MLSSSSPVSLSTRTARARSFSPLRSASWAASTSLRRCLHNRRGQGCCQQGEWLQRQLSACQQSGRQAGLRAKQARSGSGRWLSLKAQAEAVRPWTSLQWVLQGSSLRLQIALQGGKAAVCTFELHCRVARQQS